MRINDRSGDGALSSCSTIDIGRKSWLLSFPLINPSSPSQRITSSHQGISKLFDKYSPLPGTPQSKHDHDSLHHVPQSFTNHSPRSRSSAISLSSSCHQTSSRSTHISSRSIRSSELPREGPRPLLAPEKCRKHVQVGWRCRHWARWSAGMWRCDETADSG